MIDEYAVAYADKAVAITGASGYLAGALLEGLGSAPARILRVSRQILGPLPGTETYQADVRTADCWQEIVARADVIFHLASNTSVYAAAEDPAGSLVSTVQPVSHLATAARKLGRKPCVVLAGTVTQYGLGSTIPLEEDAPSNPINNYDLHKYFAEKQLLLATSQGLLNSVSLRLANVYGPSSAVSSAGDRGILNKITRMALQGAKLQLYGGGDYLRDYVYITDVARAFLAAGITKAAVGRSFNVATGRGTSIRNAFYLVARRVEVMTGKSVAIEDVPWPSNTDMTEYRNFVGNVNALKIAAGWQPLISLEDGIDRMIRHFLD